MKKIITLALVLAAATFAAHAQTTPAATVKSNPLYTPTGTVGTNPLAADVKPASPLYDDKGLETVNPLSQLQARSTGQPIGGIVVKGGQNGAAISNPIPSIGVVVKHNITDEQKTVSQPVKADKSISEKGIK